MATLSAQLDFISEAYENPNWLNEAIKNGVQSEQSDLFITEQLDYYEEVTNIRCEFSDLEEEGFGIITGWHAYPYMTPHIEGYVIDESENYAYVIRNDGGSTYVHINNLRILERIVGYELDNTEHALPELFTSLTITGNDNGRGNQDMYALQNSQRFNCEIIGGK